MVITEKIVGKIVRGLGIGNLIFWVFLFPHVHWFWEDGPYFVDENGFSAGLGDWRIITAGIVAFALFMGFIVIPVGNLMSENYKFTWRINLPKVSRKQSTKNLVKEMGKAFGNGDDKEFNRIYEELNKRGFWG